jgi:hypothetical protein
MFDPLFAITYDPQKIHFDSAPVAIGRLCKALRGNNVWVYAEWGSADTRYYIVSGFFRYEGGSVAPDEDGIAIAIRGSKCTTADAAWTMSGELAANATGKLPEAFAESIPGLGAPRICDKYGTCHYAVHSRQAEAVLEGLASDALERYSKAFGGKQAFLDALRKSTASPDIPPVLRRRLDEYRKSN